MCLNVRIALYTCEKLSKTSSNTTLWLGDYDIWKAYDSLFYVIDISGGRVLIAQSGGPFAMKHCYAAIFDK